MTVGTPGFSGARLAEAREARAMTQVALADVLGVTRQAVSMYESGAITPNPTVARQLAEALRVLPEYFKMAMATGDDLGKEGIVFFRSLKRTEKAFRDRAYQRVRWIMGLYSLLRDVIRFPDVQFPNIDVPSIPTQLDEETIERIAMEVRSAWGLGEGPISNVIWLLENHGAIVIRDDVGTADIDAFSTWKGGVPFIVVGNGTSSAVRSRFNVAHELGHLVLHRNLDPTEMTFSAYHKLLEEQAHRFASAFLMPREGYLDSLFLPTLEEFLELKRQWGVSIQAQISRAQQLGLLSDSSVRRLWTEINSRRWRQVEPLDLEIQSEQPMLIRRGLELALKEQILDVHSLQRRIPISVSDFEVLVGVPRGVLQISEESNLIPIRTINNTTDNQDEEHQAEIIPFTLQR